MSFDEIVIDVKNLGKRYEIYAAPRDRLKQLLLPALIRILTRFWRRPCPAGGRPSRQYFREFWALQDVSFQVSKGETVGIVGLNGSGKSTLLQLICSTIVPTSGSVEVKGRIAALLELGSGFNPDYTGRENVFLNGQILGLSREKIQERFDEIQNFADIGDFIDRPVKTYSSGMVVRLAFAVAINVEPEILVVDEALSVGDLAFQRKCIKWMEDFSKRRGVLLFVSHSPEQVRRLCTKAIYLKRGILVGLGPAKDICERYEQDLYAPVIEGGDAGTLATESDVRNEIHTESVGVVEETLFPDCAEQYGGERARIVAAWIECPEGKRKNAFQVGEPFVWCYRIEFYSFMEGVVFGFMVKTKEGVNLFSANSQSLGYEADPIAAGSQLVVKFSIKPNLGAGEYFLNCGISVGDLGEPEFLHRVIDSGIIVISAKDKASVGIVDMEVKMNIAPGALRISEGH